MDYLHTFSLFMQAFQNYINDFFINALFLYNQKNNGYEI